jgi:two-component system cell cycle response regulator DivK
VTSPPRHGPDLGPTDTESPLVLVVDDDERNLRLARDVLRAGGLRTLEAATGAEAIALAVAHLPDVILLDLRLPDMHGTDVARELRDDARTAEIPVVVLSALQPDNGEWLFTAGFVGSLEKPISVGEFPDQVRRYCTQPKT